MERRRGGRGCPERSRRGAQPGVVIADEELEGAEAALLEAREEVAPMDFRFAEGDAHAEDLAFSIGADTEGDEHCAIEHAAAVADFLVAGVEDDVGEGTQRPGAPEEQIGVETGGALADVGGTHGGAAEFLEEGGDFASGDALDIPLPAPAGAALRAKAPPFGYLAPLGSARASLRACSLRMPFSRAEG